VHNGGSDAGASFSAKAPLDAAAWQHDAGDLVAETRVERRLPGNELKTKTVIEHREAAGGEFDAAGVDAVDRITVSHRAVAAAYLCRESRAYAGEFALAQRADQVGSEDDALT
jgi:hypothetical protein